MEEVHVTCNGKYNYMYEVCNVVIPEAARKRALRLEKLSRVDHLLGANYPHRKRKCKLFQWDVGEALLIAPAHRAGKYAKPVAGWTIYQGPTGKQPHE